jgi:hypothetical protein
VGDKPATAKLVQSTFFMVTRPSGIEGIWHGLDHVGTISASGTVAFLQPYALTRFYTQNVVRVRQANDNRAPGLIGGLLIIGGAPAVVIMLIGIVALLRWMWSVFLHLECWPVAVALAGPKLAVFFSEVPDLLQLAKLALAVAACEFVYRKFLRPRLAPMSGATLHRTRPAGALLAD